MVVTRSKGLLCLKVCLAAMPSQALERRKGLILQPRKRYICVKYRPMDPSDATYLETVQIGGRRSTWI